MAPCFAVASGARIGPASLGARPRAVRRRRTVVVRAEKEGDDVGVGLKSVWYGAEALGKVVGANKERPSSTGGSSSAAVAEAMAKNGGKLEREQVVALLKEDYDQSYFVSGVGELAAYDPDCEFADPFVSFKGVDRFKQNVGNLGGMMRDIDLKITGWDERADELETSWRFSCVLDLPWRPKLAAAGGTTHVFDPATGKVIRHVERWDVRPGVVVKQLLLPSSKIPENRVEVFMFAASDGDLFGMWLAVTPAIVRFCGPWVAVSLAFGAIGLDVDGGPLGAIDSLAWWLLLAAVGGEVARFFKGIIGS